ncbi:MAG: DUF2461 domain-containing protein [Paludibacter sp.]|nr:DUF2461 domain-containing protein [Bacteroidales bacterium]MCM1069634.1 DUF2461 domain-containing protein [Prevotella sp.]MCM1354280.1 DUF2461 domain-containing protein [Bacteroides sp.]MCM1443119.1 DUF2461 domain-containing protein [Muribaculum sp.]MCM1482354.1 DUF2461 domain-containing protein [Paludibacter sp.]
MDIQNILDFLNALACNNNREWFTQNKDWYTACKNNFELFAAEFIEAMLPIDPSLNGLTPKDCIWRIYRDVRFSADKRPYKEWFGVFLAPHGGKKSPYGGYYVHLQPGNCMFSGGIWCPEPPLLKALRQSVYDNADEVETIMQNPDFRKFYSDFDTDNMLKKVPAGYPADWEHADWLKRKSFTASCFISDQQACSPDFLQVAVEAATAFKPLNDFLNYTFEEL